MKVFNTCQHICSINDVILCCQSPLTGAGRRVPLKRISGQ